MQSGNLKCNSTNCAHNENCECKAGAINVAGANAVTTAGTTCSSFVDKASNSFTNCADCGTTGPGNIKCEACKCTYNENKCCTASNVQIDAQNSCCDTFCCGKNN